MAQLSFDYDSATGTKSATYRGLTIKAVIDECANNPFEEMDGYAPCLALFSLERHSRIKEYGGQSLKYPFSMASFTDELLRRHMVPIAKACNFDPATLDSNAKDMGWDSLTDAKRELLTEALDSMGNSDKLEALATIYTAIGWPALCTSTSGYCQGDYIELLFVATPAWREAMGLHGRKYDASFWAKDMTAQAKLYGAWAWGDVYGFVIESPSGEKLDSCWGFYGSDMDESGLSEAAISSADCILSCAAAARAKRQKELIANRVPLELRAAELARAGEFRP